MSAPSAITTELESAHECPDITLQDTQAVSSLPARPLVPPYALYPPLDPSKRQIRLLTIDKGHKLGLQAFDLDSCPPYTALSYVWGEPNPTRQIEINDLSVPIRPNLYDVLRVILLQIAGDVSPSSAAPRMVQDSRTVNGANVEPVQSCNLPRSSGIYHLWVDAICIMQSSIEERNHQVQMMGHIYMQAGLVLVWLGSSFNERVLQLPTESPVTELKDCLDAFLQSIYWTRVWCVQELVLGSTVGFLTSDIIVPFDLMDRYLRSRAGLPHHFPGYISTRRPIALEEKHQRSSGRGSYTLKAAVKQFRSLRCEHPLDEVFGLLSLVNWEGQPPLLADYSLSPSQLYDRLDCYAIQIHDLSTRLWRLIPPDALRATDHRESDDNWDNHWDDNWVSIKNDTKVSRETTPPGTFDFGGDFPSLSRTRPSKLFTSPYDDEHDIDENAPLIGFRRFRNRWDSPSVDLEVARPQEDQPGMWQMLKLCIRTWLCLP